MKTGVIDRFEGDCVLIEIDGVMHEYQVSMLAKEAREGDAVLIDGNKISVDKKTTAELKKRIEKLMDDVWED